MDALSSTRAGGDQGGNACKMIGPALVETAGAPASSTFGMLTLWAPNALGANRADAPEQLRGRTSSRLDGQKQSAEAKALAGTAHDDETAGEGDSEEQWIELIPAGTFYGRDGRGPYRLDDPQAVIAATRALRLQAGIPIDYDHATEFAAPQGRPAPAAGWIKELEVRQGAIWGRVQWTARAARAIRTREYRYVSPVFQYARSDHKVTRLLRAGLTNNPNLYLTAIAAAADKDAKMEEFLTQLKQMLGLDAGASFEDILQRLADLLAERAAGRDGSEDAGGSDDAAAESNSGSADPARFVAIADFQQVLTELNTLKADRAREKAERAVDDGMRAGKLVPAQREWAVAYCAADPKGFAAFIARQPAVVAGELPLVGTPRAASHAARAAELSPGETAICAQLGILPASYLRRKRGDADFLSLKCDNPQTER